MQNLLLSLLYWPTNVKGPDNLFPARPETNILAG
jgi:hypothetical protein